MVIDVNHGSGYVPFAEPTPPSRVNLSDQISLALDAAIVADRERNYRETRGTGSDDVAYKRIGAAYIGLECDRALAYRYHRYPREKREEFISQGELHRHALSGHWTEASTIEWMRLAGFDIHVRKDDGNQYGYKVAKDQNGKARIAGEIDGVILGAPKGIDLPTPLIWESKKATQKKWNKFAKNKVRGADIVYYGQVQTNMAYLEVEYTLFSMLCLDTMKFYWELIKFDPETAQKLSDRAVRVINSKEPSEMARVAVRPDFHVCRFCEFHGQCWGEK